MNREQALVIAKEAYKSINNAIDKAMLKVKNESDVAINCEWDGCIKVDEYFFCESELVE